MSHKSINVWNKIYNAEIYDKLKFRYNLKLTLFSKYNSCVGIEIMVNRQLWLYKLGTLTILPLCLAPVLCCKYAFAVVDNNKINFYISISFLLFRRNKLYFAKTKIANRKKMAMRVYTICLKPGTCGSVPG